MRFPNTWAATPCTACKGFRLRPESLAVRSRAGTSPTRRPSPCATRTRGLPNSAGKLDAKRGEIAKRILKEILDRLSFLVDVGLDYLTLSRAAGTLSGGESQRIRLASQIGSGLTGVLYVLDEPSIGLHQRDNARLLETLRRLRDLGNSVIVVEHDEDAILSADYVVDVGPGAGIHGGEIVAKGTAAEIMADPKSLTGQYLTGERQVSLPRRRRRVDKARQLRIVGASGNNLKNVSVDVPLGLFTCITGVSGGGKSTLIVDTLYKAVARRLNGALEHPAPHVRLDGLEHIDKVIDIDQSPIGPHAALESGDLHRRVHTDARMVRRTARRQGARLPARPLLVQRQRRALRSRRQGDRPSSRSRCTFCRTSTSPATSCKGKPLQPRNARNQISSDKLDRRRAAT